MAAWPEVKLAETKDLKSFGLGSAILLAATNLFTQTTIKYSLLLDLWR